MNSIRHIFLFIFSFYSLSMLRAQIQDTVLYQRDAVIEPETDQTVLFFQQNEKAASPTAIKLVTKANKIVSLQAFLQSNGIYADHVLADIDKDGKKELLVSNYTGGAHCCDEIYLFKNIAPNRYQQVVRFFAGNTTITGNNEFIFNFHETFGYFFTCFACSFTDTTDEAPIATHNIILKYSKGKAAVIPGDKELRSTINDNLGKLGELPYQKLDTMLTMDEGLRKEIAMNLAVFYYSFGRNLLETQKLFNKYYKHPDAKKVWTAFVRNLQGIKKDNDF